MYVFVYEYILQHVGTCARALKIILYMIFPAGALVIYYLDLRKWTETMRDATVSGTCQTISFPFKEQLI